MLSSMFLLVGILAVAVLFLWAARRPDTIEWHRSRLQAGALIMVALSVPVGYGVYRHATAASDLEQIVPVVPGATTDSWVPQVSEEEYWIFEGPGDLDRIASFYDGVAAREGWQIEKENNGRMLHLELERDGVEVTVSAYLQGKSSRLIYTVKRSP